MAPPKGRQSNKFKDLDKTYFNARVHYFDASSIKYLILKPRGKISFEGLLLRNLCPLMDTEK